MSLAYLGALVFSIIGLGLFDWRFRMALFRVIPAGSSGTAASSQAASPAGRSAGTRARAVPAATALVIGVALFLAWDLAGIALGVFFRGQNSLMTGALLAPELPLEELFFLILLCYTSLICFVTLQRLLARVSVSRA